MFDLLSIRRGTVRRRLAGTNRDQAQSFHGDPQRIVYDVLEEGAGARCCPTGGWKGSVAMRADVEERIRSQMVALLPRLHRFALLLTGSRADADDLVQATCERAITRLNAWMPGTALDRWLFKIAHNLHRNQRRDHANRLRLVQAHGETQEFMEDGARRADAAFSARARRQGWAWSGLPIAASVVTALIVGGGAVLLAEHRAEDAAARMVAAFAADRQLSAAAFTQALDRQVSGQSVSWHNPDTGSGGSVTPLRTFRAADGRYCREYEQRMTAAGGSELRTGIACRDGRGWRPTVERPEPA
jgi:RNA polymerase sigma factor (sigma-70 family)